MTMLSYWYEQVRIVDIDSTIIECRHLTDYSNNKDIKELTDSVETIRNWFKNGDYILLFTSRDETYRDLTISMLDSLGVLYHQILFGKPKAKKIDFYDDLPITMHKIDPEKGLGKYIEEIEEKG